MQAQSKDVVIDVQNEFVAQGESLRARARKALLAGLGVAAFTADEVHAVVGKLAARGEDAEGELRTMLDECRAKLRRFPNDGVEVAESFRDGVESFISGFSGSHQQEITQLNERISELTEKIAALEKRKSK